MHMAFQLYIYSSHFLPHGALGSYLNVVPIGTILDCYLRAVNDIEALHLLGVITAYTNTEATIICFLEYTVILCN